MKPLPLHPHAAGMALHLSLRDRPEDALDALDLYIKDQLVRHFSAWEVVQLTTHKGVTNTVPTPMLWQNIVPTIHVLEWLRSRFGNKPVRINSGYRSADYNKVVGGASESLHRRFSALDIRMEGITPGAIAAKLETHTDSHQFGVGVYDGFVHLDTRGLLGMPRARWDFRPDKAA